MSAKQIIEDFYKSDALINSAILEPFLHPDVLLDWNSSKGFIQMNRSELLKFATEISKAYISSKVKISHIIAEDNLVSVRYSHYIKTFENPREEMLLAHFIVIWEIKEGKIFRGYQMSQLS
jgi:predicted SnoaL-like aldol condensation-catalyzing enzyme